jgi:hypothetical protein
MRTGWIPTFALVAVAALLCNAQCYANCVNTARDSDRAPSGSCHHHKSSQGDAAPCPHQHSEFSGPEAGVAKLSLETITTLTLPALTQDLSAAVSDPQLLPRADTGSPPGASCRSAISVLRI